MPSLCKESHYVFPRALVFSDALDVEGRLCGAAVSLGLATDFEDARSSKSLTQLVNGRGGSRPQNCLNVKALILLPH